MVGGVLQGEVAELGHVDQSQCNVTAGEREAHAEIGLDLDWPSKPFVEQTQLLQEAYKTCLVKHSPAGSYTRNILQVASSQVAKKALEHSSEVGQVQGGELGNPIDLFLKRLSIQD